ncbi:hypothetical protein M9Y10_007085 [Tritrichomonas musculus]|uniref:SUN domain-containing protein n=1 Tax=Tritrichomonas musculus TaxID=1915356 RepID=A0ABR2J0C7_9EUKA
MSEINQIKLTPSCIFGVPFHVYAQDFTFIVNDKEFKTSHLIAELLSSKICQMRSNDPTCDTYVINTEHQGDFQQILNLVDFNQATLQTDDLVFLLEVIESLENNSIELTGTMDNVELTADNVFTLIQKHEKFPKFYSNQIVREIEFIASHFYELVETCKDKIKNLSFDTLLRVLSDDKLKLNNEDQLLNFANEIYANDRKLFEIYETVVFKNVSSFIMKDFVSIFDYEDLNSKTWISLSARLQEEVDMKEPDTNPDRYAELSFTKDENQEFSGIIKYLRNISPSNIEDLLKITSSTWSSSYVPQNAILFEDQSKFFISNNVANSWVCFDFCEHRVSPTKYTIRTTTNWSNPNPNPKSWVIEGSDDNSKDDKSWTNLTEKSNVSCLDGQGGIIQTFDIKNKTPKKFRYIRFRQTGKNGHNGDNLIFDSFEIYGRYI